MPVTMTMTLSVGLIIVTLPCRTLCEVGGLWCFARIYPHCCGSIDGDNRGCGHCLDHKHSFLERLSGCQGGKGGQRRDCEKAPHDEDSQV